MNKVKLKMQNVVKILFVLGALCGSSFSQEKPPAPAAPRSVKIPAVQEKILPNKLKVAVVERKNVPLVTVQLMIRRGANWEAVDRAGLADMTATLLTKGTKTRSATQIAEGMEFLGGSINAGAGWNSSTVAVSIMSAKLDQAMAIMADVVLHPAFAQKEIDLLKSQTLDGLNYSLKQPGFLANFVASRYSFDEHPAGGTVESVNNIKREDIQAFYKEVFEPGNAILIFTGDVSQQKAMLLAQKFFGAWANSAKGKDRPNGAFKLGADNKAGKDKTIRRILVIDLPNSGQAAVSYTKNMANVERRSSSYFPATVMNTVLGGGYSARLNQEIRIKRGLSYGAGSSLAWREAKSNFSTRTQTKNQSAAEVAELVKEEIDKLAKDKVENDELLPRKLTLTGDFGRDLETTGGLSGALADLYLFDLPVSQLNSYMDNVRGVTDAQIKAFAGENIRGGDIIIVGDANVFMADLKKRFSSTPIEVIKADDLDVSKDSLHK
jgi:zinc protease